MAETDIPNWMNCSFFETALRSGGCEPNVRVTSSEIGRATGVGDNYASDIFRAKLQVTLDGGRSTLSLIVKSQLEEGGMAKVNILFCLMLHISNFQTILNRNTVYIFVIYSHCAHTNILVALRSNYFI
jgi:hypothetical protein